MSEYRRALQEKKMQEEARRKNCPVTNCKNKANPEHTIEFAVDNVEGTIKTTVCDQCFNIICNGLWAGFSLTPKILPVTNQESGL